MSSSRQKGAGFERLVSKEIERLSGVKTQRNLEQVRQQDQGDLIGIPGWTIECKYRQAAGLPDKKWWEQCEKAARAATCSPALIFRTGRSPIMVQTQLHTSEVGAMRTGQVCLVILTLKDWVEVAGLARHATGQPG